MIKTWFTLLNTDEIDINHLKIIGVSRAGEEVINTKR
jgi:hypothetical protein